MPLEFALASIGNRFLAVAIDHFIQYFSMFLIVWLFIWASGIWGAITTEGLIGDIQNEMSKWTIAILILVLFLMFTGYFVIFEWLWNGQTPGKSLLKLRVLREDGRPITLWESLARNLTADISMRFRVLFCRFIQSV